MLRRRFNSGRLVCNKDGANDNVFITASELGTCGRPLEDTDIQLPLSKDMFLPESLEPDNDLKQAERQRPSAEATQAQKGVKRWVALLTSLITTSGNLLKNKPVIVLNLTGYVEDVGVAVTWHLARVRDEAKKKHQFGHICSTIWSLSLSRVGCLTLYELLSLRVSQFTYCLHQPC